MNQWRKAKGGWGGLIRLDAPFFGSHNDAASRRSGPEDFSLWSPSCYLVSHQAQCPHIFHWLQINRPHMGTQTQPKETGRRLSLIKRALVYSPKHLSFAFRRLNSQQELAGSRIRAARSQRQGVGVHSIVTCSPSLVWSIFSLIVSLPFLCLPLTHQTLPDSFTN